MPRTVKRLVDHSRQRKSGMLRNGKIHDGLNHSVKNTNYFQKSVDSNKR